MTPIPNFPTCSDEKSVAISAPHPILSTMWSFLHYELPCFSTTRNWFCASEKSWILLRGEERPLFLPKTHDQQSNSPDLLQNTHLHQKHSSRRKRMIQFFPVHLHLSLQSQQGDAVGSQHQHLPAGSWAGHQHFFQTTAQHTTASLRAPRWQRRASPRTDVPTERGSSQSNPRQELPLSITAER